MSRQAPALLSRLLMYSPAWPRCQCFTLSARVEHSGSVLSPQRMVSSDATTQHEARPLSGFKLVVFGGRGFVGSAVCKEALHTGLHVVAISPSGTPPPIKDSWVDDVEWVRGDALAPQTYQHHLDEAQGVISCVGAFGRQDHMMRVNGHANVTAIRAAHAEGVPRFTFISAHIPNVPGLDLILKGYIEGKKLAEDTLREVYPDTGVILRPSVIYGTRVVGTSLSLPLDYVFGPLAYALEKVPSRQLSSLPLVGAAFVPPISVEVVAKAAVSSATDDSVKPGVKDVWDMLSA